MKKGLTNAEQSGIIERSTRGSELTNGLWKLNNKREVQSEQLETDLGNSYRWEYYSTKVKEAKSKTRKQIGSTEEQSEVVLIQWFREFDPGSGWTLAACITHSSRTEFRGLILREASFKLSGGRVSNAWATCLCVWNNVWKRTLIPHDASISHGNDAKDLLHRDGLASD